MYTEHNMLILYHKKDSPVKGVSCRGGYYPPVISLIRGQRAVYPAPTSATNHNLCEHTILNSELHCSEVALYCDDAVVSQAL